MTAEIQIPGRLSAFQALVPAPRARALPGPFLFLNNHGHLAAAPPASPASSAVGTGEPVLELFVRDLERSVSFYSRLGFALINTETDSVEMTWGDRRLRLHRPPRLRWAFAGEVDATPRTHLRLAVADVDTLWQRALELDLRLVEPLTENADGTRDFMLADPDGFGLRFVGPSVPDANAVA